MKKLWMISMIAVVAVCSAIAGGFVPVPEVGAVYGAGNSTISVSGTGVLEAEPDQVTVYLGVETQSRNVTDAVEQNSMKMDAVITALHGLGVPKERIETSYFSMYPLKDYERPGDEFIGYQVTNEIVVELHDLARVGETIDAAILAGANRVTQIEFGLTDEREQTLRHDALSEACVDARQKADAIAGATGLKILGVSTVREGSVYVYPYRGSGFKEYSMVSSEPMPVPTPIEPKDVVVTATVEIVYTCL
jgi:uncharacterized protein YggE